jgi:hypothetical protein
MTSSKTSGPGVKTRLDPAHVDKLYAALEAAGFGGMRIASLHLTPAASDAAPLAASRACHAEPQPDGSYKIVCD